MKQQTEQEKRDELLQVATQLAAGFLNENTAYHAGGEAVISSAIVYAKTLIKKVNAEFEG